MTVEEKAKAYDEALEGIRGYIKSLKNVHDGIWSAKDIENHLSKYFPELKESEEKIRKDIVTYLVQSANSATLKANAQKFNKWIAYLEKQGQKEYTFKSLPRLLDMIEPTSRAKTYCQKLIDILYKEGYPIDAKIVDECLKKMESEDVPMAIMDEKQGKNAYNKELSELLHKVICRFINDPDIPYSDREKVSMKVLPYVERLERQDRQKSFDYENANIQQKDFAPKVEPKFKVGDKIIEKDFDECSCGTIISIKDGKYIFDNGGFLNMEEQGLWQLVESNQVWSEEDDAHFESLLKRLEGIYNPGAKFTLTSYSVSSDKSWLKSLKDRVGCEVNCTTTKGWSEEDYNEIETIACHLDNIGNEGMAEVLRNIRDTYYTIPQSTWKPSDEQMKILFIYAEQNNSHGTVLTSLYNDLKKLTNQ